MGNTTTTNNKKKKSNARKIIPAIGMLMTSAAMLTTSTYAWFTMNKEVSITGISLTASVPETLEISLGDLSVRPKHNSNTDKSIIVKEPNSDDDWSNTVDISDYYNPDKDNPQIDFGRLYPVSSFNGKVMVYTDDAIGNGRELSSVADLTTVNKQLKSTDSTDRYYLDIPVWFRSTAKGNENETVNLSVSASIINGNSGSEELYKAARVSILKENELDGKTPDAYTEGVILHSDAKYNSENQTGNLGKLAFTKTGKVTDENIKGTVKVIKQTGETSADTVVQVPKNNTGGRTGEVEPMTVRIWLEGEDENCYNSNAGQSFSISLTFKDLNAEQTN